MHKIYFYKDKNGHEPVLEYILTLSNRKDKESRIKLNKINDYIEILSKYGKQAGQPYTKHIVDEIWELRPLRDRIFYVGWMNNSYVLLHHFIKKPQRTPLKEIVKARRELIELKERGLIYE